MSATLKLAREGVGIELRRGGFEIAVDGTSVGSIQRHETVEMPLEPGHHTVRVRAGRYSSRDRSVDVADGEIVNFRCHGAKVWPRYVASIIRPDLAISLRPVSGALRKGSREESSDRERAQGQRAVRSTRTRHDGTAATPARPQARSGAAELPVDGVRAERATVGSPNGTRVTPSMASRPPGTQTPALVVEHLTKQFGQRTAYSDVSFTVAQGEVFGFLGPNGAGKTTTVRTLGTLITPTSGSAIVAGIPLTPDNEVEIRQCISIMPEAPGLYARLSVEENLEFFAGLYGLRQPGSRIRAALEAVNLTDRAKDSCGSLSKGLRQRVGLARALINDPTILFLDEPTSGLDPVAANDVHDLIKGLRARGVTIFFTTHRLDEAELLCDHVAILNTTLRTIGSPAELREELFSKALIVTTAVALPSPEQVFAGVRGVESWRTDSPGAYSLSISDLAQAAPEVTRALVGAGADVLSITESKHSLEDVYMQLVDEGIEVTQR